MYDFVVLITFDELTEEKIMYLKKVIENNGIKVSNTLPPHITVDLYENIGSDTIIGLVDQIVKQIGSFPFQFSQIDTFGKEVLFLQPNDTENFQSIKNLFGIYLSDFRIKNNANNGIYHPHSTLATGDDITQAAEIINGIFVPLNAEIQHLSIYDNSKKLIKRYALSNVEKV